MDRGVPDRLRSMLDGPLPVLPRPADLLAERWARLRPRARLLLVGVAVATVLVAGELRVQAALRPWGGTPVSVLVAGADLAAGAPAEGLVQRRLPPGAVPPGALGGVDPETVLALALPAGNVLTSAHLQPRGPAAALGPAYRAVPIPVEVGWGVVAGGWVDVWVLGAGEPADLIARSRPVLELREEGRAPTALVGLHGDEVSAATAGLALGQVLLTHAPPPPPGG